MCGGAPRHAAPAFRRPLRCSPSSPPSMLGTGRVATATAAACSCGGKKHGVYQGVRVTLQFCRCSRGWIVAALPCWPALKILTPLRTGAMPTRGEAAGALAPRQPWAPWQRTMLDRRGRQQTRRPRSDAVCCVDGRRTRQCPWQQLAWWWAWPQLTCRQTYRARPRGACLQAMSARVTCWWKS